ncbi:MAG: hypothetical protein WDW36_005035 [Sanguina aurantia]
MATYAARDNVPGSEYTTGGAAGAETELPASTTNQTKRMAADTPRHHNPHDSWSSKDLLLAFVPVMIAYAFRDAALRAGLIVALAFSVYMLAKRFLSWGAASKHAWPYVDVTNVILFTILLGIAWPYYYTIYQWLPIILPAVYASVFGISLITRRPVTAHYANYALDDNQGAELNANDASWRFTADMTTLVFLCALSAACVLSLVPTLTGHWYGFHALNIVFNYIVPLLLLATSLITVQGLGFMYR